MASRKGNLNIIDEDDTVESPAEQKECLDQSEIGTSLDPETGSPATTSDQRKFRGRRGRRRGRGQIRGFNRGRILHQRECHVGDGENEKYEITYRNEAVRGQAYSGSCRGQSSRRPRHLDQRGFSRPRGRVPILDALQDQTETMNKLSLDTVSTDEKEAFTFLIRNKRGMMSFYFFVKHCKCVPNDMKQAKEWVKTHSRFLKYLEVNGRIECIVPVHLQMNPCLYYSSKRGCTRERCNNIHVCKWFIHGLCRRENCPYSHSLRDDHNQRFLHYVQMSSYSDEEIMRMLRNRYPRVCGMFNETTGCARADKCFHLHICYPYIIGKCDDTNCGQPHSFDTMHNRRIMEMFRIRSGFFEGKFKRYLFLAVNYQSLRQTVATDANDGKTDDRDEQQSDDAEDDYDDLPVRLAGVNMEQWINRQEDEESVISSITSYTDDEESLDDYDDDDEDECEDQLEKQSRITRRDRFQGSEEIPDTEFMKNT